MTILPSGFTQSCQKRSKTTILFKGDTVVCGDNAMRIPSYSDLSHYIAQLLAQKRLLQREYARMTCSLVQARPVSRQQFDGVVNDIRKIDTEIDEFLQQYSLIPPSSTIYEQLRSSTRNDLVQSEGNIKQTANIHSDFLAKLKQGLHETSLLQSYVIQESEYVPTSLPDGVEVKRTKKTKTVRKERKEKPPPTSQDENTRRPEVPPSRVKISPVDRDAINKNIEQLLKAVFKFKDTKECSSKARSAAYFQTKEQIIKSIEEHEALKKLMPSNYKSLNKEQLCEALFKAQ